MVSFSDCGLSNGNSMKRPLENGCCLSSSGYKRRKVSVIREFPPGCGRDTQRNNLSPGKMEVALVADVVEGDGVKTSGIVEAASIKTSEIGVKTSEIVEVAGITSYEIGVNSVSDEVVKSLVQLEMGDSLDDLVGKVVAAAGDGNGLEKLSTYLEPMAIELPKGLVNNSLQMAKDLYKVQVKALVKEELNEGEVQASVKEELHEGEVQALVEEELCERGVQASVKEELHEGEVQALVEEELCERGVQALVKEELHEVEVQATVKTEGAPGNKTVLQVVAGAVPVGSAKLWSPSTNIPKEAGLKNKYPRRRRVLANREFPPFCGRNAPLPTEEDRLRIISGNKTLGAAEKVGVERGTSRGTMRAGGVESAGNVRDGNVRKSQSEVIAPEPRNKSQIIIRRGNEDVRGPVRKLGKDSNDKSLKRRPLADAVDLGHELDTVIVQGLMAAPNCTWRQGKGAFTSPDDVITRSKVKKRDFNGQAKSKLGIRTKNNESNHSGGKSMKSVYAGKAAYRGIGNLVVKDVEDYAAYKEEQNEDSPADWGSRNFDVSLPPFGPNSSAQGDARNRVRETLRLFQAICRKILQGEEAKSGQHGKGIRRIDLIAAKIVKNKGKEVNTGKQILGAVPGVEVGDEFRYRVELAIVGIHRLYQAGIDCMKHGGVSVAVSIVASGGYDDELDNADVLIYSGQGGNIMGRDKQPEDQKLEKGNLALKNSILARNPVRVIRGSRETKAADSLETRSKVVMTHVYDGLYMVEKYWQEVGPHGKLVFKFELRRIPGQPELAWKEVKKSKKFQTREGLRVDDISGGKEVFPICAVNTIDNEKPPPFNYVTKMIYPDWYRPIPPEGCDCTGGCMDSRTCSCASKNGGEIPYNYNGAIVEAKPLVYECGPSCNCPASCFNRVSQHGIKIQLEIFKTESRGWGVRSLNSIPSGSFICEYTGELLKDKEAEQKTGNDEYLFDIGQNYTDNSLKPDAQSSSSEVVEDGGFTIDAAENGNIGRFINHSCSPNLYAQNVLYDHEDKRMPHIMLFAAENIPPLQELTYHYNYSLNQVQDSNGNIKMKSCYCGSAECTGRMY